MKKPQNAHSPLNSPLLNALWRTSGFLTGLSEDLKSLAPARARGCLEFKDCLDAEARRIAACAQKPTSEESTPHCWAVACATGDQCVEVHVGITEHHMLAKDVAPFVASLIKASAEAQRLALQGPEHLIYT